MCENSSDVRTPSGGLGIVPLDMMRGVERVSTRGRLSKDDVARSEWMMLS